MGLKIGNSPNTSYDLPERNAVLTGSNNASVKAQNLSTASNKPKLPPITDSVDFTALGCDTEQKLARASYMAAASKAGVVSESAQREFADQMIARHSSELAILGKKEISLDDAKVKESLNNRSVSFKLSPDIKAELAQFRENYVAAGGKIRYSQTPRIDLREPGIVGGANDSAKTANSKFQVLLNNSGNPTDAKRVLAQFAEDSYKGGNLWGQNYRQIGEMSAAQGVKPKITNVRHIGNKVSVEFELTPLDRAKIHENYKTVQTEVNRAVAAYEDFANNNEVSSFLRGVFNGALKSVKGTIGLLNLPETMEALWQVVAHPVETFNALYKELGDTWEEFKNAPPNKKSEMVGELVGQAIVEILIGKGIGKAGSILAKTKTGAEILEQAKLLKTATVAKIAETFSDEAAEVAKQSAKSRLRQSSLQLNSGLPIDPSLLRDLSIVAGNKLKNGALKFAEFSDRMVKDLGEKVKPHLENLYREKMTELGFADQIDEVGIKAFKANPPLEGKVNYQVHDPKKVGRTVVDIDRFEGNILWEEKSATSGFNKITGADETAKWISKHITKKFGDLAESRRYLPDFYKDAEIGFDFVKSGVDPNFKAAVESEIQRLSKLHPDVKIHVSWR